MLAVSISIHEPWANEVLAELATDLSASDWCIVLLLYLQPSLILSHNADPNMTVTTQVMVVTNALLLSINYS